jgi:hypothetical protein
MSFSKNTKLVNKIKIFTTLLANKKKDINLNKDSNLNKKDPLLFLIGLISLIVGVGYLRTILSDLLNRLLPSLDSKLRDVLTSNNTTEQSNINASNFSFSVPMTLVDYNDKFKIDPNSIEGTKLRDNKFMKDFSDNVLNKGTGTFFGGLVQMNFDKTTNSIKIGNTSPPTISKEEYMNQILSNIKVVDTKTVSNMMLDSLFNTISRKKSLNGIKNDLSIEDIIKNILNGLESTEAFKISLENIYEYEVQAKNIKSGKMVLDFGCGVENLSLDKDFLNNNFQDPLLELENALDNALNNSGINSNPAIMDNFYSNAIHKMLLNAIKGVVFSPEMIFYLLMRNVQFSGNVNAPNIPKDPTEYLKQQYYIVKCIICELKNQIIDYVFQMFKRELLKLVLPVIKEIVKEKILSYKNILLSLVKSKFK